MEGKIEVGDTVAVIACSPLWRSWNANSMPKLVQRIGKVVAMEVWTGNVLCARIKMKGVDYPYGWPISTVKLLEKKHE